MLSGFNNKIVYHGSYMSVPIPDLSKCANNKDFGRGFYVTTDKQQAIKFAKRAGYTLHKQNYGVLNTYILTDLNGLLSYEFLNSDINWLNCIVGNRRSSFRRLSYKWEHYDVIAGKVADDDTNVVLTAYISGYYGIVGSAEASALTIKFLEPENLKNQICFRTNRALSKLQFIKSERIRVL